MTKKFKNLCPKFHQLSDICRTALSSLSSPVIRSPLAQITISLFLPFSPHLTQDRLQGFKQNCVLTLEEFYCFVHIPFVLVLGKYQGKYQGKIQTARSLGFSSSSYVVHSPTKFLAGDSGDFFSGSSRSRQSCNASLLNVHSRTMAFH